MQAKEFNETEDFCCFQTFLSPNIFKYMAFDNYTWLKYEII
jgi:hypothetical protein